MKPNIGIRLSDYGIPLREQKYAMTKVTILNHVLEELEKTSFDQINITDLCKEIRISKRTFFNYYNSIHYVFLYLLQVWIIDTTNVTRKIHGPSAGLSSIETAFEDFGKKISEQPRASFQIFSSIFSADVDATEVSQLTKAEMIIWGGDALTQQEMPALGFHKMLADAVENAKRIGELPHKVDLSTIELSLNSILIGVPFTLKDAAFSDICNAYKTQLKLLWCGLRNI